MLVTLLFLFVLTLRSGVVTFIASLSSTLVIVISMVFINNSGVVSNNTRINKAFFMFLLLWDFVTLLVFLVMTMRTIMLLIL